MDKVYPLPLSRNYVRHWTAIEAIRELIQNGIDSKADFEYALLDDGVVLRSRGVILTPETLVLGVTSKADDADKIGSFGEGYKIALLVLTREGRDVKVVNGALTWTPEFRHNDAFGAEMLHIVEKRSDAAPSDVWPDLEFRIFGLSADELQAVQDSCLLMQAPMEDAISVPQGRILPSQPGRLYVGGLFICTTELRFGYDIKPQHITLERDRQTVADWDLKRLTCDMWQASGRDDFVAELIEDECKDVAWLEYIDPTEAVAEACYRRFSGASPTSIPVANQVDYDRAIQHRSTPVFVSPRYYRSITRSPSYRSSTIPIPRQLTPQEELQAFLKQHRTRMQRLPRQAMEDLIGRASGWKAA